MKGGSDQEALYGAQIAAADGDDAGKGLVLMADLVLCLAHQLEDLLGAAAQEAALGGEEIFRGPRSKRRTPISSSIWESCRLSVGWVMWRMSAALEMVSSRATVRK